MPRLGPVKRKDLISNLRTLGFDGPFSGGKHQFMVRERITLRIPNPHRSDIGRELLVRILRQAGIDKENLGVPLTMALMPTSFSVLLLGGFRVESLQDVVVESSRH